VPLRWGASEDVRDTSVTGCPWCRRPVTINAVNRGQGDQGDQGAKVQKSLDADDAGTGQFAYTTLLRLAERHDLKSGQFAANVGLYLCTGLPQRLWCCPAMFCYILLPRFIDHNKSGFHEIGCVHQLHDLRLNAPFNRHLDAHVWTVDLFSIRVVGFGT